MNEHNILGGKLKVCSTDPITGYRRNGYCSTDETDQGNHLVCSKMNKDFLNFTKSEGNDLTSVVKEGDNWCLCQNRWLDADKKGKAPKVIKEATNSKIRQEVKDAIILQKGAGRRKKTRKKRGGWSRDWDVDSKGEPYYDCPHKEPYGEWTYKDGIEISNESAGQGRPTAQVFQIIRMNDRDGFHPMLNLLETTRDDSNRRVDRAAETMCRLGFKPLKKNESMEGSGRKKKTRKKQKKQFLYNPNDPSKSFDVYIDKNPNDTIPIKYTTVKDVEDTIKKLERLYKTKKYPHKRIWQVGMIMKVRLEAMNKYKKTRYPNAKNVFKRYQLSKRYFKFLGERSKKKSFEDRKKMTFNINMKKKKTRRKRGGRRITVDQLIPGKRYIVKAYHSDPPYPGDTEPESKEYTATFVKIERGWTRVKFRYPTFPYYTHYDPDVFAFGEIDIQDLPKDVNDQINEYYGGGVKNTRCKKGGEIKEVAVDDLIPGKRYTIYFRDRDFANRIQAKTKRETFISVERGPRTIIFKDRVPKVEYSDANYHRRSYSDLELEEQEIRSIHEIDIQDLPKDVNDKINEYLGGRKKKRKTRKGGGKKKRRTTRKKRGGVKMKETIVKFKRGPYPKKYTAIVKNKKNKKTRKIHFGDRRYQQYKDRTPLKLYKSGNHNTIKRMQNYFSRHSGTKNREEAIKKEKNKSNGIYNAKILSHVYLW